MLKNVLAKSTCLFFLLAVLCLVQTKAQTKTCDLQLEVIQNPESADAKETPIKDAEATFVSKETKEVVKAGLKDGMPYFAKLPGERYRLSITKKGHKTTIKVIDLDCSLADNQGVVSEIIFLWKGDGKQTVVMSNPNSTRIPIQDDSQPTPSDQELELGPKVLQRGVVNGKAIKLVKPPYPQEARESRASGAVTVQILINEDGNVISAKAISGDILLHKASEKAALKSKFIPTFLDGRPVKVNGVIVYNFVP